MSDANGSPAPGHEDVYKQGFRVDAQDGPELRGALEAAFDYRGNVTVFLKDGGEVCGYLSNRDWDAVPPNLDLLPAEGGPRRRVSVAEVRGVSFSGKDTAAGKSWETWVRQYEGKKEAEARGETTGPVGLFPEPLD